jgi:hypothetical protein
MRGRRARAAAALFAGLVAAGCGGAPQAAAPKTTGPEASCASPSPIAVGKIGPEVVGRGKGAQLHGLVMARAFPLAASRHDVKIVWRMTGSGPLAVAAYDAQGRKVPLAWGPEPHGGSNYRRPGDEWGVGYRFAEPGCYRLTARRSEGSAEVWLRIRA